MNSITFTFGFCHAHCLPTQTKSPEPPKDPPYNTLPKLGITLISHATLRVAARYPGAECYIITMIAMAAAVDKSTPVAKLVPLEYYNYLSAFLETEAHALPP